jgi:hypothetical protein
MVSKKLGRAIVALFVIALALGGAALFAVSAQVGKLQTAVQASCAFAADLGTAPLPASPKPGKLGVKLVSDSRAQWRELRCPGTLPPAPGLDKWARVYGLPGN